MDDGASVASNLKVMPFYSSVRAIRDFDVWEHVFAGLSLDGLIDDL